MLVVVAFFVGFAVGAALALGWHLFAAFGFAPITFDQGFAVAYCGGMLAVILAIAIVIITDR